MLRPFDENEPEFRSPAAAGAYIHEVGTFNSREPISFENAPDWAKPGLLLISESGFFRTELSVERLQPLLLQDKPPMASTFGVGCVWTHGISLGVPVDTLSMAFRQILINQRFGISNCVLAIGRGIAEQNEFIDLRNSEVSRKLRGIEDWHREIFERLAPHFPGLQVVSDIELRETALYRKVLVERQRAEEARPQEMRVHPYSFTQDVLFEAIRRDSDASVKGGWVTPQFSQERLLHGHVNAGGGCEGVFDSWSLEVFPGMSYFYGSPAISFSTRQPTACPYTAKPVIVDGEISVDDFGRPIHGRILLHQRTLEEPLPHSESLYRDRNPSVANLNAPDFRRFQIKRMDAIESSFELCRLAQAALAPGLIRIPVELFDDVKLAEIRRDAFIELYKSERTRSREGISNERYAIELREHLVQIAEAKRLVALSGIPQIIHLFGASGGMN